MVEAMLMKCNAKPTKSKNEDPATMDRIKTNQGPSECKSTTLGFETYLKTECDSINNTVLKEVKGFYISVCSTCNRLCNFISRCITQHVHNFQYITATDGQIHEQ